MSGQTTLSAIVAVLLLMMVAGALVDGLSWMVARHEALRITQDAALQATRAGLDYDAYISGGEIRLNEVAARERALAVVAQEASARWAVYDVQVEVLPEPGGGVVPGFPPHPNAGPAPWTSDDPAVGVYLAVPVESFLLEFLGGAEVHVFAAAEAETQ